jgi:hypothetical protein
MKDTNGDTLVHIRFILSLLETPATRKALPESMMKPLFIRR